jgi:hypothetical protein
MNDRALAAKGESMVKHDSINVARHTQLDTLSGAAYLSGHMKLLRGVKFLRDASGRQTAVVIDLRRHRSLWEDFADVALARQRAREPKESIATVRARLVRAGRLKRSG